MATFNFRKIVAIADMAMLQNTVGGEDLSAGMLVLLALVTCDDYLLFPSAAERALLPFERSPVAGGTVVGAIVATAV